MDKHLFRSVSCALLFLATAGRVRAVDLKVDFNERSAANNTAANTEGGFQAMVMSGTTANQSGTTVATFGAQTVTISSSVPGTVTYSDRKRAAPVNSGAFNQQALLQDFVFAVYSAANPSAGLDIAIGGLTAGKEYAITLWSFDNSSGGNRVSNWTVNGVVGVSGYSFDGRALPTSNSQYQIALTGTADASGQILISGRRDNGSVDAANAASHGVFLNALWVRDVFLDSDGDGMPDGWETAHGLNKDVNDAALDPDNDQLTNLQEYLADTDPQDPDSDNDGLIDGYENGSGIWVSPTNTGTNPNSADTDGDGLGDALENPTLPWLGASQPGTDPNRYDTDGDGFSDREEINWPVSPLDITQFPNPADGATLAVDLENIAAVAQPGFHTLLGPGTAAGITSVSNVYGAYNVTITAAGTVTLESRDRASAAGGLGFNPMFRDFIFCQNSDADGDGMDVTITGLAPSTVYPVTLWSWDPTSTATPRHSTWLASDGENPPVVKVPLYSLEGATIPSQISDRRMQFEAKSDSTGKLVIQGRKENGYTAATINVFLNAFVIGTPVPQGPPIVITGLGPVTPLGMTLTWTSEDSAVYKVEVSPDLITWTTLSSSVDGQADLTTFTDTAAPAGTLKRFYRVSRVP